MVPIPSRHWQIAGVLGLAHVVLIPVGIALQRSPLFPDGADGIQRAYAVAEVGRELAVPAELDLDLDLPSRPGELPAAVEVVGDRIAQEAITNVVRHARASSCRLAASVSSTSLVLVVADDGDGGARPGVGLRSMREPAAEIGGSVEVSSPGRGTRVTLTLPLGVRA